MASSIETMVSGSGDPDLAPGSVVGEYCVEGKLGRGGFGTVFKASHPLIGKVVAIKVLSRRFSADPEMVSRFVAEARAVNQIRHRNIIDIFAFGQLEDNRHYYIMEYVEGETLDRRLKRGSLSLVETLSILRPIARALDAAHLAGIAHRDLKAENVVLATDADGSPFPKLLDFGIAKLLDADEDDTSISHRTRTGAPMGTPYYMSPEQSRGRNVDHRTDHYAFGVLAYLMLTGRFPLDGPDYMSILMRQVHDDPPPASHHVPGLPEPVDHALAWCMAKSPDERPPDLTTVVRALEVVAGITPQFAIQPVQIPVRIPTMVTSPSLSIPPPPVVRSSPRRLAILAVAVVTAAAITFAITNGSSCQPTNSGGLAAASPDAAVVAVARPIDASSALIAVDAPAEPTVVTITLDGAPPNAEVRIGGQLVGVAPRIQIPRGSHEVMLVLDAEGYQASSFAITPDRDRRQVAKLKPRTARPPIRRTGSSDEPTNDIERFPR